MDQELPHDRGFGDLIGILAVDVWRFSAHNDAQQKTILDLLPAVLRDSATKAGLRQLWDGHVFRAFRGDGYLFGVRPDLLGAVVDRYFDSLQNELRRRAAELRASGVQLRLRASLHLGPVESFDALVTDSPHGKTMIEAGRMVDSAPVRALLDHSDAEVTFVASVVSGAVMEHVVEAGKCLRKPSEFVRASLKVDAKEYEGTGYLRVPTPSGELLTSGLLAVQQRAESAEPAEPRGSARRTGGEASTSNTFDGIADTANQVRDVRGGFGNGAVRGVSGSVVVTGNNNVAGNRDAINVAAERDAHVDRSTTTQEFSGAFLTQGDGNFGPNSGRRTADDTRPTGR
ncbi:hypothetical protein [Saccharomonospora xinjiangensis]|uniref:Guanylate cyclase domain-containing protein n=1 Tax=Saccharomonospora xinjiangensis XJ-54 TaxID=882086 RepID=I0V841_9PSEU|nr:hypothetical protein [Saccharomonospora xinjiangensis]EID56294.1 hypothetical protein SacxiDRAFT_4106 [Saccharomonospora xinjiangensis XJ-54]